MTNNHEAQTSTSSYIHNISLKEGIRSAKEIEHRILGGISDTINMLGVEMLGANVLAVLVTPGMTKVLETETRERLQQERI